MWALDEKSPGGEPFLALQELAGGRDPGVVR
jgi:hypothetical protein